MKALGAALLAALLCFSLAACGGSGDLTATEATTYVQGLLDRTFLGQFNEDYMDLVGTSKETMEEYYRDGLVTEAERFIYYYDLVDVDDDLKQEIVDFYEQLYKSSKYEVAPAAKLSTGGFACEVTVYSIDLAGAMDDPTEELYNSIFGQYTNEEIQAMSDEDYAQLEVQWREGVVDLAYDALPNITNSETATYITVQVKLDEEDDMWSLVDTDFDAVDSAIIAY